MLKHTYETMNEKLTPDRELMDAVLERMAARRECSGRDRRKGGKRPTPARAGRVFAIALASVLAVCLSLTAVAAAVPEFSRFLQSLLPKYGGYLQPVSAAPRDGSGPAGTQQGAGPVSAAVPAETEGVRLNVLAAASDLDTAAVYFTLTDPEGRLSPEVRAEGVLELDGTAFPFAILPENYDPDTKTATYCQRVTQPGGIDGAAASLTVTAILGQERQTEVSLDLGSLELDPAPETVSYALPPEEDLLAQAYPYRYETLVQDGSLKFLVPQEGKQVSPGLDGLLLTGAAYVEERLHLQFRLPEYWRSGVSCGGGSCSDPDFEPGAAYSAHSFELPFTLEGGAVAKAYDGVMEPDAGGNSYHLRLGTEYLEVVDRIPEEALPFWTWFLTYTSYETAVQGEWTQDFTLNSASDSLLELTEPFTVEVGTKHLPDTPHSDPDEEFPATYAPASFDGVRITPFAVTISRPGRPEDEMPENDGILKRFAPDTSKLEVSLRTGNSTLECVLDPQGYTVTPDGDGRMTARYLLPLPVDPREAAALTVNGVEIPLR